MSAHTKPSVVDVPGLRQIPAWLFRQQRAVWVIAALLLVADIGLIAVHCFAAVADLENPLLKINVDRGYAEALQAVKFLYLMVLVTLVAITYRSWSAGMWFPVFAYLLIDDLMMIHEIYGGVLVRVLGLQPAFGLRAQDFGEVLVTVIAVVVLSLPLLLGYLGSTAAIRWVYRGLVLLMLALGVFGVGVDLVHTMLAGMMKNFDWIGILEDGGEMVVVTFIAVYLIRVVVADGRAGLQTVDVSGGARRGITA